MAVEKSRKVENVIVKQRNIVLVGIKIDESGKEILKWALEEIAEHGDCVVVVHVCSTSRELSFSSSLLILKFLYGFKFMELVSEL